MGDNHCSFLSRHKQADDFSILQRNYRGSVPRRKIFAFHVDHPVCSIKLELVQADALNYSRGIAVSFYTAAQTAFFGVLRCSKGGVVHGWQFRRCVGKWKHHGAGLLGNAEKVIL